MAASTRAVLKESEPASTGSVTRMARSTPIARERRSASWALEGPILTAVTSLLPTVSRSLIAAEMVLSSPGSRTSETPLRTSRLVLGSSLLTTVLGSGICLTQTYIFMVYSPQLYYVCAERRRIGSLRGSLAILLYLPA